MSVQVMSDPNEPENASFNDGVSRRSANFQPSAWGDYFLSCNFNTLVEEEMMVEKRVQKLKEEVRGMLAAAEKASNKLSLIDAIQRLGLYYHFDGQINEILEGLQKSCDVNGDDENLHSIALRFRLLRQQGYYVSSEIFNKFTNDEGNFKESLINDERGVLSLYEAAHLRIQGENILEEALAFTINKLKAMAMDSSSPFAEEANYALKWPIYKALPRLMTRHFIYIYDKDPSNNNVLLTFAKLDFNVLQKLYQKEIYEISRWWKDLKLMEQLSFARDRAVESYVWALGVYYEPKYSHGRRILAKIIALAAVLDDMYDLYATMEELELFTDAIERWDINGIDKLPEYMKVYYEALFEVYLRIEQDISKDNIQFAIHYAKEAMKRQCRAFFAEAKWFHEGYVPTIEEYMKVAIVSTCYHLFATISFLGMKGTTSKEAFEWIESDPLLLKATGVIGRLMNDITSHKFEQERGDVASAVECYMNQHRVSEQEVLLQLEKQVVEAWKDITEDYMKSSNIPNSNLMCILNLARLSDLFYKEEDGYTFVDGATKHFIALMLIDPVPI